MVQTVSLQLASNSWFHTPIERSTAAKCPSSFLNLGNILEQMKKLKISIEQFSSVKHHGRFHAVNETIINPQESKCDLSTLAAKRV